MNGGIIMDFAENIQKLIKSENSKIYAIAMLLMLLPNGLRTAVATVINNTGANGTLLLETLDWFVATLVTINMVVILVCLLLEKVGIMMVNEDELQNSVRLFYNPLLMWFQIVMNAYWVSEYSLQGYFFWSHIGIVALVAGQMSLVILLAFSNNPTVTAEKVDKAED